MPADAIWVQGDAGPVITDNLTFSDGTAAPLTGATVTFQLRSLTSASPLTLTGTTTVTNTSTGAVQFTPSVADTSSPVGDYMGKWFVVYSSGQPQTFPTDGFIWVRIGPNVAAEPQCLVSLPDVKDYLNAHGIDRTHDAKILHYIEAATPIVENIVGPVLVHTIDEWHAGGSTHISLRRRPSSALGTSPILNLVAVSEYIGPIEWPLAIVDTPDKGQLYSCMLNARLGSVVRRTAGGGVQPYPENGGGEDVHVIYQAGQQTVPPNVREATLEAIRQHYTQTMPTGTASRSIVDEPEPVGAGSAFAGLVDRIARQSLAPMKRFPSFA